MLLLAFQVSIQPKISQSFLQPTDNQVSIALLEELVKTGLAAMLFWVTHDATSRKAAFAAWSPHSSLVLAAAPAALYAFQGVLTYHALQRLDAVTFNGLSQLKTAGAALWCYILLGKPQSPQQFAAIVILLGAALLFQNSSKSKKEKEDSSTHNPRQGSAPLLDQSIATASSGVSMTGITACLGATLVSGLAGALSQRGLQYSIGSGHGSALLRDPFFYAGEVSLYSAMCLGIALLRRPQRRQWTTNNDWTKWLLPRASLWIPVTIKAVGGIVTVLVHKHAGSVLKGFALVLGLVLSGMYEPNPLTPHQWLGTVLVLVSSWMHFTSPPPA